MADEPKKPAGAPPEDTGKLEQQKKPPTDAEAKKSRLEGEHRKEKEQTKEESHEEQAILREKVDRSGEAKEYIETFRMSTKFDVFAANLEVEMELSEPNLGNFEKWLVTEPRSAVASFFEHNADFPQGRGQDAFLEGLQMKTPKPEDKNPEAEKFRKSHETLVEIVKILREHFEMKRTVKIDMAKNVEKPLLGETCGTGIKTLMKNFHRADGWEKAAILGAVGVGLWLLFKLGKKKIFKDGETTYGTVMMTLGAAFGINYLSGKVAQDGKTILQRIDLGREIDDLSDDNILKGYAEDNELGDDQEKLRAFIALQTVDVKKLFQLYEDAGGANSVDREIDTGKLGKDRRKVDGKAAFEIIDSLVKETSVNEHIRKRQEDARRRKIPYQPPKRDDISAWESPGVAMDSFREKYIEGEFRDIDQTLLDAIVNEYRTEDARAAIRRGKSRRLIDRTAQGVVDTARSTWLGGKEVVGAAAVGVWNLTKDGYRLTRDHVWQPLSEGVRSRYNKYMPRISAKVKEVIGWKEIVLGNQETNLNKILPKEFSVDVTANGEATILGFPKISFDLKTRADGKDIAIIDSIEFVKDDASGNAIKAQQLKTKIETRVSLLVVAAANKTPVLSSRKIEWDSASRQWRLKEVPVNGDALLGIPGTKTDLQVTVGPDGKTLKFYTNGKEITDFGKLEVFHRDALVQEEVWKADVRVEKYLRGLEVYVLKVEAHSTYGAVVTGKIEGLEFKAALKGKTIKDGLLFFDGTKVGGADLLKLEEKNGATEFLEAASANIMASSEFLNPFLRLEDVIDRTGEGVWERVKEAFATTRLWIIPTNLSGAINGKILHRQWKFMLDLKKMETLDFFESELKQPGKTVADIEGAYHKIIDSAANHLESLAREIDATPEADKATRFQEFLSGEGTMPGLEYLNYSNADYRKLSKEYKTMVTDNRFNYPGLESIDDASVKIGSTKIGGADEAFEIYAVLMRVWSYHTRKYAVSDPDAKANPLQEIHPGNQRAIRNGITNRVRAVLENAAKKGGDVIRLSNLPPHQTEADLDAWVDPNWSPAKGRPAQPPLGIRWAGSSAILEYKRREAAGKEPLHDASEKRDVKGSINPTPENLDAIRAKLKKIFDDTFPTRYASKFSSEYTEKYKKVIGDLPEALLLKAITENGSEEELLEKFESEMKYIRDKAAIDLPHEEVWNVLVAFFNWVCDTGEWELKGDNPHVQNKKIKPRHKTGLANQLEKLKNYYKKRLEDKHGHWYGDAYNEEKVKFLEKVEIPFYTEFYMNRAILSNQSAGDLGKNYSEFLKTAFRECIEDPVTRREQETADVHETASRTTDANWTGPVQEMEGVVKT